MTADIVDIAERRKVSRAAEAATARAELIRAFGANAMSLNAIQCRWIARMLDRMERENGRPPE